MRVPEGWRSVALGEIAEILIGGTPARSNPAYWDIDKSGKNRWAAISDLKGRFLSDTAEYITDLGVRRSNVKLIPRGTPLMSFKLSIGRTAITRIELYTNEAIAAFLPRESFDPAFLAYALPLAVENNAEADQAVKGKTLNKAKLTELQLLLPPLAEQTTIAAILSSVDEAIEATQAVIDQLQVVKKAMMGELLTKGIPGRHSRFKKTEIGEVPEGWGVAAAGDILADGPTNGRSPRARATPPGVLTFSIGAVRDGKVDIEGNLKYAEGRIEDLRSAIVRPGDILIVRGNGNRDLIGRCGRVEAVPGECIYPDILMRVRVGERMLPEFFNVLWNSDLVRAQILDKAKTTNGTYKINGQDVRSIVLPVPPLAEQQEIADAIDAVSKRVSVEEEKRRWLYEVKSALLSVLLTGEVRVRDGAPIPGPSPVAGEGRAEG